MPSIVDKSSVKKVCVDDFALRKRFSYGTVMVDLESHKIIDLIPTRNTNEVKECSDYQSKEYIQRRSLIQLIYKGLSDVKTITKTQYEQVLKTYPVITELYAAIKEFYEILYSRRDERLETWLEKIENFDIPELQTYVNGIRIDINAVKNGIKLKYNNGLAEGSVNKIKVIKRIMYGRNSFDLLKAKVLLHEQFRCEFN